MLSKLEQHDTHENNKVSHKSICKNQYSKPSTLCRSQLEIQQRIESWYPSYHFLIILPEKLVEKIIFDYLMASDMHSLTLTSFIKQFTILHGGNTVDAYKKDLVGKMKYESGNNLFLEYHRRHPGYSPIRRACEKGDMTFVTKYVSYTRGTEHFFRHLTTQTKQTFSAFFTAIFFGKQDIVKYLLNVDEEINGCPTLLFHRTSHFNLLHLAVLGCKDENGFELLLFLVKYTLKHDGFILLNEVVHKSIGTILDLAFKRFEDSFGKLYQPGTELWYCVKGVKHLQSLQCTRIYGCKSTPLDDLTTVIVTTTLEDGSQKTIRHEQYVNVHDENDDDDIMDEDTNNTVCDNVSFNGIFRPPGTPRSPPVA